MNDEIALFIDFENIRYSLINVQHREPDPQELITVARRFGTVMVARAYADWSRQPDFFKGSLTAAMIDRVDCPAKVRERFRQNPGAPFYQQQGPYNPFQPRGEQAPAEDEAYDEDEQELGDDERELESAEDREGPSDERDEEELSALEETDEDDDEDEQPGRSDPHYGYANSGYHQPQQLITQSTVDLNMLMDIIETVFDRPSINTFVLMSGDRDFTRICARLKLRLNKRVIVVGVPGTVSRDLISAAEQFVPLGQMGSFYGDRQNGYRYANQQPAYASMGVPVEPEEAGFIQFLDYIDKHWSWRTIGGVANFIGDPFNPKNRFRGRLTRESARDLLRVCVDEGILNLTLDQTGSENLRLNRDHPAVTAVLSESAVD